MFNKARAEKLKILKADIADAYQSHFKEQMRERVLLDTFGSEIKWEKNKYRNTFYNPHEVQFVYYNRVNCYQAFGVQILFSKIDSLSCEELFEAYGKELRDAILRKKDSGCAALDRLESWL